MRTAMRLQAVLLRRLVRAGTLEGDVMEAAVRSMASVVGMAMMTTMMTTDD